MDVDGDDEYFETYNSSKIELNKNVNRIRHESYDEHTCYGHMLIPLTSISIYRWKFKIIENTSYIVIGIDEEGNNWVNHDFSTKPDTQNYSYYSGAQKFHNGNAEKYGISYSSGDIIEMVLDLLGVEGKLKFIHNGKDLGFAFENIERKNFKMAIYTDYKNTSIELINFSYIINDKTIKTPIKIDEDKKVDHDTNINHDDEHLNNLLKKQENEIKRLNNTLKEMDKKNENLYQENQQLSNQYDELQLKSLNEMKHIINGNDQYIETITNLQQQIKQYKIQMERVNNEYNKLKFRTLNKLREQDYEIKSQKEENHRLQHEIQRYKERKGKQTNDTKQHNEFEYEKWNLKQIILWIKSLENGRFIKYINRLNKGFMNDGINSGDLLPEITKYDLRNKPFNIENFRDRKDLELHFKSLLKYEGGDKNNKEGTSTPYL